MTRKTIVEDAVFNSLNHRGPQSVTQLSIRFGCTAQEIKDALEILRQERCVEIRPEGTATDEDTTVWGLATKAAR